MNSEGSEAASVVKKKSGPRPAHAVPSLRSLASKVVMIASRRPAGFELARLINCGADIFSVARAEVVSRSASSVDLHIGQLLYAGLEELLHAEKLEAGPFRWEWATLALVC